MAERILYNVTVTKGLGESRVPVRSFTEAGFNIIAGTPPMLLVSNRDGEKIALIPVDTDTYVDMEPVKVPEFLKPDTNILPMFPNDKVH
jgi:hypothetical protein